MAALLRNLAILLLTTAACVSAKVHDPSSVVKCGKQWWYFSTGPGIQSASSPDLQTWTEGPPVFKTFPDWHGELVPGNRGYLWAPDVIHRNGRYWLYYSVSTFGKNTSAIGLVSTPTLDPADKAYAWKDEGVVLRSNRGDDFNAIDPAVIVDADRRLWLTFGSFWSGIQMVELDPATGLRKKDARQTRIAANREIEAPAILFHDKTYFLFVNWGLCCKGVKSTYEIRVGRSRKITGPFLDENGDDLAQGGGTVFFKTEGTIIGPGHVGTVEGHPDRFVFHYYDGAAAGAPKLGMRELEWTKNGWPRPGKWVHPK